jgi:hypothetical protein
MLEALARGVSPTSAANAAGVGRSTAYLWRQEDREFAAKGDEAVAVGIDRLETEAYRRALEGSDKLLMFLKASAGGVGAIEGESAGGICAIARRGRES